MVGSVPKDDSSDSTVSKMQRSFSQK